MKTVKIIWRVIIGAGLLVFSYYLVSSQLNETSLKGGTILRVALMAVGASMLAGAFD